jgi:hypothetical protein
VASSSNWGIFNVSSRVRRIFIALGLLLALGLLIGVASGDRLSGDDDEAATEAATSPVANEPPLSTLPTPESVQTLVFERAFSECASYDISSLAGKYNVAVKTEENIARAVAEGWARQFDAGQDALADGRDGCLQGFSRR